MKPVQMCLLCAAVLPFFPPSASVRPVAVIGNFISEKTRGPGLGWRGCMGYPVVSVHSKGRRKGIPRLDLRCHGLVPSHMNRAATLAIAYALFHHKFTTCRLECGGESCAALSHPHFPHPMLCWPRFGS